MVFRVADIKNAARLYAELADYTGCRSHIRDEHWDSGLAIYVSTCGLVSYEDMNRFLMETFGGFPRWILQWRQARFEVNF